jgi:membrane associated rhomboid family serine protease
MDYVATASLTAISTLLWFWKRELPDANKPKGLRVKTEQLEVSGNSLGFGLFGADTKPLTLISATLMHATRSHIINNYLMIWGICELERKIGSTWFAITFFLCGACGWLGMLLWLKLTKSEEWSQGIAQFSSSLGSSPATYGMCAMAAVIMKNEPIATTFGWPPHVWMALMMFLPKFCGDRFKVNLLVSPLKISLKAVLVAINVVSFTYFLGDVLFPPPITAGQWFLYYLLGNYVLNTLWFLIHKGTADTTDHACHFGGATFGVICGLIKIFYIDADDIELATISEILMEHKYVCISMSYLLFRMVKPLYL